MKRFLIRAVSLFGVVLLLFFGMVTGCLLLRPRAFAENYQRGFVYQYRALERAEGRKIITLGGSNVSFNVDTAQLTKETGVPAYNLGNHASMGYCYTFELAERFIGAGDIVLFPLWHFTKADYGMELIWLTLEGESDMIWDLVRRHPKEALTTMGSFAWKKLYQLTLGQAADAIKGKLGSSDPMGYSADGFDAETGNYIYERSGPSESRQYMISTRFGYTESDFDDWYVTYLNDYIGRCREKGAEFYFVYSPICELSLANTREELANYEAMAAEKLDAPFLMKFEEAWYDYEMIYNMPTHLNSAGVAQYTSLLAERLRAVGAV